MTEKTYAAKNPERLAHAVVVALWVYLAADIVLGVVSALHMAAGSAMDAVQALGGLTFFVVFLVSGVVVLKWIYRTNKNAHTLATGLTVSPGWAVGWFFVPIASLWKPFQGVEQTWKVSANPVAWQSVVAPTYLRWWWGLWIVSNILSNLSFRISRIPDLTLASDALDVISTLVDAPLTFVLMHIVRRVTAMQAAALEHNVFD